MKLIKIMKTKIQIRTDESEFENVRLNNLILITDGDVELVTLVSTITDNDTSSELMEDDYIGANKSMKLIECSIIGSMNNGKFEKVVDRYPTTNIISREITSDEFSSMISGNNENGFCIGNYTEYDCPAIIDGNKFYQRHACIVGNTGSGKSETVAKILEETAKLPGANIVVFDIHGEYGNISYVDNIKIGPTTPFPVWMFGFSGMVANILKIKEETSSVAMSALRKCYKAICPNGNEGKPCYFDYGLLVDGMEQLNYEMVGTGEYYKTGDKAGLQKTVKGDYNGKLTNAVNLLKSKMGNKKYAFLFEDTSQYYLNGLVSRIMAGDKPVKNIDLSQIPHDVAIPIIGVITKLIYDIQCIQKDKNPIVLVCDEAHVYIPNNHQLSASEKRMVEIFEDIAKEGRKFGTTLFLASQRPSELNKTIMAQCANFIVSKLNNENDKSMIKGMLPDGSEAVIDSTTMFKPGDVLVIGDAAPIPLKMHVELAKERPNSRTINFWDVWSAPKNVDIEKAMDEYMAV